MEQPRMDSATIVGESVANSEPVATEETVVAIRNNLTQGVTVSYWKNGVPCDVTVQPSGSVVCDLEVFESAHYKDLALAGVVTQIQSPRRK